MAERPVTTEPPDRLTVLGRLLSTPRRFTHQGEGFLSLVLSVQRPKPGVPPTLQVVCGAAVGETLAGCAPGAKLALSGHLEQFHSPSPGAAAPRVILGFWADKALIFEQLPVRS